MNLNLLAHLSFESICVIYAVMIFMIIIGKRSTKLFYCIFFSLVIAGLTTGFYLGTVGAMPMMIAFIISFFINYFISLVSFVVADKANTDNTFLYLLIWQVVYNAIYFLIVFLINSLI